MAADAKVVAASKGGELTKQAVALAKDAKEVAADAKVVAAAQAKQVATSAGDLGKEAARRTELTALKIDEVCFAHRLLPAARSHSFSHMPLLH